MLLSELRRAKNMFANVPNLFLSRDQYVHAVAQRYSPLRLVIGAGGTRYPGWLSSDLGVTSTVLPTLWQLGSVSIPIDITNDDQWRRVFDKCTVHNMLSEHVFEHLSTSQLDASLALCREYLVRGGRFRIAVPDGRRPDQRYISGVAPPVNGHLQLFTIESLTEILSRAGFAVEPIEYYDDGGHFHRRPYDEADGVVLRCYIRDRHSDFAYADRRSGSIILDAMRQRADR
jgi:predicted SAM-dependent methyltransferase